MENEKRKIAPDKFVPGYVLEAKIGAGGMGMVYRARQESLGRKVAIKILSQKLNKDPQYVARFEREAKIAAQLNHKGIVSVLETGVAHGYHYYVMEYVDGTSLAKILEKRIFTEQEAIKIVEEIAEALAHADKHKIIHRDIKPENIMLTKDGQVKLCDLGIAKQTQGELATKLTITGEVFGTVYYISPEQFQGEELDIRSDIYSLGITLYQMVTGRLPFQGKLASEVASQRLTKDPIPPRKANPKISPNFNNLILRMIARKREHRYANPAQLIASIQHLKRGAHISAPPNPYTKRVALAAGLLVAIIAVTAFLSGGGSAKRETELFAKAEMDARKLLTEKRFAEAMSIVKSFKATEDETKSKAKKLIDEVNELTQQEFARIDAEAKLLWAKGDFEEALKRVDESAHIFEGTASYDTFKTTAETMRKDAKERKVKSDGFNSAGYVKLQNKDSKNAIEWFDKAIELTPQKIEAYVGRGRAKDDIGDHNGAIADFTKAIELEPLYIEAHYRRGVAKSYLGEYESALADYDQVIKINPNYAEAYHCRSIMKSSLHNYKGAIEDCNEAIRLNPNFADAYYHRGSVKYNIGDYKGAMTDYDDAINLNPNYAEAYYNRGTAKIDTGDYKGALEDFEKAIKFNPSYNARLQSFMDKAKAEVEKEKNSLSSLLASARSKYSAGDYKGSLADYDKIIKINPNEATYYNDRGYFKYVLGDYEEAIVDFSKAIELDLSFGQAFSNRGLAKYKMRDYEGALKDHNKAVELAPNQSGAFVNRGLTRYALDDFKSAIEDYDKAINIDPNNANAFSNRGITKLRLGNCEEAVADMEKAISINPKLQNTLQHWIDEAKAKMK